MQGFITGLLRQGMYTAEKATAEQQQKLKSAVTAAQQVLDNNKKPIVFIPKYALNYMA